MTKSYEKCEESFKNELKYNNKVWIVLLILGVCILFIDSLIGATILFVNFIMIGFSINQVSKHVRILSIIIGTLIIYGIILFFFVMFGSIDFEDLNIVSIIQLWYILVPIIILGIISFITILYVILKSYRVIQVSEMILQNDDAYKENPLYTEYLEYVCGKKDERS